jgi:hypothetical protein
MIRSVRFNPIKQAVRRLSYLLSDRIGWHSIIYAAGGWASGNAGAITAESPAD